MDTHRLPTVWQQLEAAVDFIESRLAHPFDAPSIASAASMSVWQLHRLFQAAVGESLMDYVRRRRLASTLGPLRDSRRRILDIALDAGFDSHEVFCRAFRREYRCSPGQVRRGANTFIPYPRPCVDESYVHHRFRGMQLEPVLCELPSLEVAGRTLMFDRGQGPTYVPSLWKSVIGECGLGPTDVVGVTDIDSSHPNVLRYFAGFPWGQDAPPAGWTSRTLAGGLHACFDHVGHVQAIEYTVHYIHAVWLPQSEWEPAGTWELERYPTGWQRDGSGPPLRICVPIQPKGERL